MPVPKPEGDSAPHYMALESLPIDIPWIPGATATYDLIRCADLSGAAYDEFTESYAAEEQRLLAAREALPKDAPLADRKALETAMEANTLALSMALLTETRCQVRGINPTPVPGQPATWAHLHPSLRFWLAHAGRGAAAGQLVSPLAQLRPNPSASR